MKKHKKLLALLLAAALVFTITACDGGEAEKYNVTDIGANPNAPAVEATLDKPDGMRQLTIYYRRAGHDYSKCDMWMWVDGGESYGGVLYTLCEYGAKVILNVPDTTREVGFIARFNCSDVGGREWGDASKDGSSDRFAVLTGDYTTVYLSESDARQYTSADGGRTFDLIRLVSQAEISDIDEIAFTVNSFESFTSGDIQLVCGQESVKITAVVMAGERAKSGAITTAQPLDLTKTYTLRIAGYPEATVLPGAVFDSEYFVNNLVYDGDDLGASYKDDGVSLRVWAPTASAVSVRLYADGAGGEPMSETPMSRAEKGTWTVSLDGSLFGVYYTYLVTTAAGAQEAVDPYARAVGVNGERGMLIDLDATDPVGFAEDRYYAYGESFANTDAVVWEIHVRDFSNNIADSRYKGKYLAFTETGLKNASGIPVGVDHIKDLGVTHVHLLPSYDYATVDEASGTEQFNWGYDPKNYNVPEGSYATDPFDGAVRVNEFKQMVAALHQNGMGVVMDVVYNHTYAVNSNLNRIVPNYYYRLTPSGAYSNGSGCGNETASEREMMRKYIVESVLYWQREYHIDGFRFDLMGLHDIETMRLVEQELRKNNPNTLIYGEGWTGGSSTLPSAQQATLGNIQKLSGIAMFNDIIRNSLKGDTNGKTKGWATGDFSQSNIKGVLFSITGGIKDGFAGSGGGWYATAPTQTINYVSAHDNLALWDKINYSNPDADSAVRLQMNRLCAAVVMTSQGVPFMQAGEELLRDKINADGSYNHNSYNSSDEVNNLKWERLTSGSDELAMCEYYKGLIAFRKANGAFRLSTAADILASLRLLTESNAEGSIAFTIEYEGALYFVAYNASAASVSYPIPDGVFALYIDATRAGTSPLASGISGEYTVAPYSCIVLKSSVNN